MKHLLLFIALSFSVSAIACQSKVKKFKDMRYDAIECGLLGQVTLVEPKILYQGDWVRLAIKTIDGRGECPKNDSGCFMPHRNWKKKMNAFCQKLGFKQSTTTRTYVFHRGVETVGLLDIDNKGRFSVRPAAYNDKLSTLKKIYCL